MVLYGIVVKTEALGSTDGFAISLPTLFGIVPETKYPVFSVICIISALCALAVNFYLKTTYGKF